MLQEEGVTGIQLLPRPTATPSPLIISKKINTCEEGLKSVNEVFSLLLFPLSVSKKSQRAAKNVDCLFTRVSINVSSGYELR